MKVIIIGASGFGKEVLDILNLDKDKEVIGFIDPKIKGSVNNTKVLGDDSILSELIKKEKLAAVVAIADWKIRKKLFEKLKNLNYEMIDVIHPHSYISKNAKIGEGVIIYGGVIVNTNVEIGNAVLLNSNASIGHDTKIESFVNINPNVSIGGKVKIKMGDYIGIGATVIQEVTIGENTIIGAGAAVIRDIPHNVTAVGVPAKVIKNRK